MTFVIDTELTNQLAEEMDKAADEADGAAVRSRRALDIADLESGVSARLSALADTYRYGAAFLRLTIEAITTNTLTVDQFLALAGLSEAVVRSRLELLNRLGIVDPLDVLGALLALGPDQPAGNIGQLLIGVLPPDVDEETVEALSRLSEGAFGDFLIDGIIDADESDRADLERVASSLLGGSDDAANGVVQSGLTSLSLEELSELVAAGAAQGAVVRQASFDVNTVLFTNPAVQVAFAVVDVSEPTFDGIPVEGLRDDELPLAIAQKRQDLAEANALAAGYDISLAALEVADLFEEGLATAFDTVFGTGVGDVVKDIRGLPTKPSELFDSLIGLLGPTFTERGQATRAAANLEAERLLDLGLNAASRQGINLSTGDNLFLDGTGNFVDGDGNQIRGSDNGIIGNDNTVNGDNNRVHGGDNQIDGERNRVVRGNQNIVIGNRNEITGSLNRVFGDRNFVSGFDNLIGRDSDFNQVTGSGNTIADNSDSNIINGNANTIDGDNNISNGNSNEIEGDRNEVNGSRNEIDGDGNVSFGDSNEIDGDGNRNFGDGSVIDGDGSISLGDGNSVDGDGSIAFGDNISVEGDGRIGTEFGTFTEDGVVFGGQEISFAEPEPEPEPERESSGGGDSGRGRDQDSQNGGSGGLGGDGANNGAGDGPGGRDGAV